MADGGDAGGAEAGVAAVPRVEFLEHGVVVVRGALSMQEQCLCLATSLRFRSADHVEPKAHGLYSTLYSWAWPGPPMGWTDKAREADEPALFDGILRLGRRALDLARFEARRLARPHERDPRLRLPDADAFSPDAVRGILYPANGRLHAHQDMHMGWVGSLSVGRSCEFFFATGWEENDPSGRTVRLDSGDAAFFNGQTLVHGVSRLLGDDEEGAVPPFWARLKANGVLPAPWERFNMQLRDGRAARALFAAGP